MKTREREERKRFIIYSIILVVVFVAILVLCSHIETTYTREARVITIEENEITFLDENDNLWVWEKENNEQEYKENEIVVLKMNTKGTDTKVEDDEIVRVKRGV